MIPLDKGARAESFYLLDSFYCFPFGEVPHGSKIIVYGAGYVGQLYEAQIRVTQWCQIVCFVDKNWKFCEVGDIGVCSPQLILSNLDSFVVIAIASLPMGEEIKASLLAQGVKEERIIYHVMPMPHQQVFRQIWLESKTRAYFWTVRKLLQIVEIKDNTLVRVGGQMTAGT